MVAVPVGARRTFQSELVEFFLKLHGLQAYANKALNNRYEFMKKDFSVLTVICDSRDISPIMAFWCSLKSVL